MKRLIYALVLMLAVNSAMAQCHAFCAHAYDSATQTVTLVDHSFVDNPAVSNIVSVNYFFDLNGTTQMVPGPNATYTFTGVSGVIYFGQEIHTSDSCSNFFVDSVLVGGPSTGACAAYFTYAMDTLTPFTINYTGIAVTDVPGTAVTYLWDFQGGTPSSSTLENPTVSFPGQGYYFSQLTITTTSGCVHSYFYSPSAHDTINANDCLLTVNSTILNESAPGHSDGSISLDVSGGYPPYYYHWSNQMTTEDISGLSAGVYTLTIGQSQSSCPNTTWSFNVDCGFAPGDTLFSEIIDTCFTFTPDSLNAFPGSVTNDSAVVTWIISGGGTVVTLPVVYYYDSVGTYSVVLLVSCDSAKSLMFYMVTINFADYLGVAEESAAESRVYPNPFGNHLRLDWKENVSKISVWDVYGRMISSASVNGNQYEFETSSWASGVYYIRLESANHNEIIKVVKK